MNGSIISQNLIIGKNFIPKKKNRGLYRETFQIIGRRNEIKKEENFVSKTKTGGCRKKETYVIMMIENRGK